MMLSFLSRMLLRARKYPPWPRPPAMRRYREIPPRCPLAYTAVHHGSNVAARALYARPRNARERRRRGQCGAGERGSRRQRGRSSHSDSMCIRRRARRSSRRVARPVTARRRTAIRRAPSPRSPVSASNYLVRQLANFSGGKRESTTMHRQMEQAAVQEPQSWARHRGIFESPAHQLYGAAWRRHGLEPRGRDLSRAVRLLPPGRCPRQRRRLRPHVAASALRLSDPANAPHGPGRSAQRR